MMVEYIFRVFTRHCVLNIQHLIRRGSVLALYLRIIGTTRSIAQRMLWHDECIAARIVDAPTRFIRPIIQPQCSFVATCAPFLWARFLWTRVRFESCCRAYEWFMAAWTTSIKWDCVASLHLLFVAKSKTKVAVTRSDPSVVRVDTFVAHYIVYSIMLMGD